MENHYKLPDTIQAQGVLVVEDSALQRSMAVEMLRSIGVSKIYEAGEGREALEVFHRLQPKPAFILLDLEMAEMDGIETVQQLALDGHFPALLIASGAEPSVLNAVAGMVEALGMPLLGTLRKPLSRGSVALAMQHFDECCCCDSSSHKSMTMNDKIHVADLREAIHAGQVLPFYQPKMRLENGEICGVEALARWCKPDGELIAPDRFIPLAESNGLIDSLTLCMLEAVLLDIVHWQKSGFHPVVSINVSALSLESRQFASQIIERVNVAQVSPALLVLEITESSLVGDLAAVLGTLGRLRLKGFALSIDDYGTGFSSMQQLSRLPFTELKLDRSFVRHSPDKWQLRTILETALSMGERLGLVTVAEGVETQGELNLLRSLGCKYAQGYLIAAPMPAGELLPWLANQQSRLLQICSSSTTALPG